MVAVSVIVPVYNSAKYLQESILSICNQSLENIEIIVINDGSTDDSKYILQNLDDERIQIIDLPTNQGISYALNCGIDLAKGKYIARADSDDVCESHRLKTQMDFMEDNLDVGASGSYMFDLRDHNIIYKNTIEASINKYLAKRKGYLSSPT